MNTALNTPAKDILTALNHAEKAVRADMDFEDFDNDPFATDYEDARDHYGEQHDCEMFNCTHHVANALWALGYGPLRTVMCVS